MMKEDTMSLDIEAAEKLIDHVMTKDDERWDSEGDIGLAEAVSIANRWNSLAMRLVYMLTTAVDEVKHLKSKETSCPIQSPTVLES